MKNGQCTEEQINPIHPHILDKSTTQAQLKQNEVKKKPTKYINHCNLKNSISDIQLSKLRTPYNPFSHNKLKSEPYQRRRCYINHATNSTQKNKTDEAKIFLKQRLNVL